MNGKQQTAVSWLKPLIKNISTLILPQQFVLFEELFEKALEMERQQMINAQMDMFLHINQTPYGLQYLNQREEAHEYAEQYFTNTYHTEP